VNKKPKISIIVRTKNEDKWISACLESIFRQTYENFEIILVDNCSTDKTLEKAKKFAISKIVTIEDFLPGLAINQGIRNSTGEYICCISGHCIPTNEVWLENLLRNFEDKNVAGVYGRQEPLSFTSDLDKRDLINLFGLDRKVQKKDSFFHNANSMIRRDIWDKIHFDEEVTNIEDRVWAKEVLEQGYSIVYEPEASVYHYHGVHQTGDRERAGKIVKIMNSLDKDLSSAPMLSGLNIIALIPATGDVQYLNGKPLIEYTIEAARNSKYINNIIVTTDNEEYRQIAKASGAQAPFLRPAALSYNYVDTIKIYHYTLEKLKETGVTPDLVVLLEQKYPFRVPGFIDRLVEMVVGGNYDTVLAARKEYKMCWGKNGEKYARIDNGVMPTAFKDPIYISLLGLGCVTHPHLIYEEEKLGQGKNIQQALSEMKMVAEGYPNAESAFQLIKKFDLDCPVLSEMYGILYKNQPARESIQNLMSRPQKSETEYF
jgi:glycosyltransferase involved in cell wall biosynthesis